MSWDPRAERIAARAEAAKAVAEAEAIRVQADIERARVASELESMRRKDRAAAAAVRRAKRQEFAQGVGRVLRERGVPFVAVGSPEVIAWNGQYSFAVHVMKLGVLSPLLPVAIEGSVLYCANLTHQAIAADKPTARYRAATAVLAGIAAGQNVWHGLSATGGAIGAGDVQVGIALGLTSLLSIGLLELTAALRKHTMSKRSAEQIRQALIRRVRFPVLSVQAAAIAAARGIDTEAAWTAAWVDRYGVGPDATRRERRTARRVLARRRREERKAVRRGDLVIEHGTIAWADRPTPASEAPSVRQVRGISDAYVNGGLAEVERFLADQVTGGGALRELPAGRADERSSDDADERTASAHNDAQPDASERSDERSDERSKRPRRRRGVSAQSKGRERLEAVRRLLSERPDMSGADIATALTIPESTARRLRARVLRERGERS